MTQSNVYDASGTLLVQSDLTNGTTLFLGDTELHVAAGSSTASAVRTYMADGIPFAERDTQAGVWGNTLMWLLPDLQNTVIAEQSSSTGTITRRYTDPFGNSRATAVTWSSAHGFLNAPVSAQSGLTLLGAREYDATLGRFLSVDSVLAPSNPQQNNGYSYSQNDPVTLSDPSGLCSTSDDISGCWKGGTPSATGDGQVAAAPGGGYSKLSSHFYLATNDSHIKEMRAGFRAVKAEFGLKGKITEFQELSVWQQLCFHEAQSACSCDFSAQIGPPTGFMPDSAAQAVQGAALSGSVFFSGGAAAAFALNLANIQVKEGGGYVNLASDARTNHILFGDSDGEGGHMAPGNPGKTLFPEGWSAGKIMNAISDVATDPSSEWKQQNGAQGAKFDRSGAPVRFRVVGQSSGLQIRVIVEPEGEGIITGFPEGERG